MAQKVTVLLVDDVDGGEAEETVKFALDGVDYEIDLSGDNAHSLRTTLEEYVAAGRRIGRNGKPQRNYPRSTVKPSSNGSRATATAAPTLTGAQVAAKRTPAAPMPAQPARPAGRGGKREELYAASDFSPEERTAIRTWGRANGFNVSDRGRWPAGLATAWVKAGRPM